ncbi:OsmC family protein [Haloprofundus halobius]|uniref:OsmC family protein n=1 Tax=Haloprofundus halobius TaxID=2876194 RepID=UPI001CCBDB11|nr:OsmC family protein [Haloprofundus halobius]
MAVESEQEGTVTQGVDVEKLKAFLEFAEANPEDVQFDLEATGVYEGRAIHTKATTGPYTLGGQRIDRTAREYVHHLGGHREVEDAVGFVDPTDRQEVIELALAALSGCINAAVSMSAIAAGIELDTLETSVRIAWDPFVFLHLEEITTEDGDPVDMFGDLEVDIEVDGDGLGEDERSYIEESVGRSAVYNLVTLPHRCRPSVRRR